MLHVHKKIENQNHRNKNVCYFAKDEKATSNYNFNRKQSRKSFGKPYYCYFFGTPLSCNRYKGFKYI